MSITTYIAEWQRYIDRLLDDNDAPRQLHIVGVVTSAVQRDDREDLAVELLIGDGTGTVTPVAATEGEVRHLVKDWVAATQ